MQLLDGRADYKGGHYAEGGKELLNIFNFFAKNTDVEWLCNGYNTQNDNTYILATMHKEAYNSLMEAIMNSN